MKKKKKLLKGHSKSQEDIVLRFCSSCQEAAEAFPFTAATSLFKFDSYRQQDVTSRSYQGACYITDTRVRSKFKKVLGSTL